VLGIITGTFAPGRCSDRSNSKEGDSSGEHLVTGHNLILVHAAAVRAYRGDFKERDGGIIGATLNGTVLSLGLG
jgi:beta-glucosidase